MIVGVLVGKQLNSKPYGNGKRDTAPKGVRALTQEPREHVFVLSYCTLAGDSEELASFRVPVSSSVDWDNNLVSGPLLTGRL